MTKLFIRQNLGLGDHIICNAIIRHYAKDNEVELGVYPHNLVSVKAMFADLPNVTFKEGNDSALSRFAKNTDIPVLYLGYGGKEGFNNWKFDSEFYRQAALPFEMRWKGFKHAELEQIKLPGEPHIFIHQDLERGFKIDPTKLPFGSGKFFVGNTPDLPIGAFIDLLQNAVEIHCIDSSFALLADSIPTTGKKFIHRYARPDGEHAVYKNSWEIIV